MKSSGLGWISADIKSKLGWIYSCPDNMFGQISSADLDRRSGRISIYLGKNLVVDVIYINE